MEGASSLASAITGLQEGEMNETWNVKHEEKLYHRSAINRTISQPESESDC